jgi:putative transposase
VQTLIGWMFHITVGLTTVWQVLHRAGFTPQQPVARAVERDEHAIEHWRRYQWPAVQGSCATWATVRPALSRSRTLLRNSGG